MRGFQRRVDGADKEHDHDPVVDDLIFHDIGINNNFDEHRKLDKTSRAPGIRSQNKLELLG